MLSLLLLILSFLIIVSPVFAGTGIDYDDANCQGAWLFTEGSDETVADDSQNTNTGNFKGAGEPSWETMAGTNAPAYADYMVDYDSTNDFINVGSDASLDNLSPISAMAWANPNAAGQAHMFSKRQTAFAGWRFSVTTTDTTKAPSFIIDYNTTDLRKDGEDNSVTSGEWNHVVATWDGTDNHSGVIIYVNGTEVGGYQQEADGVDGRKSDAGDTLYLGHSAINLLSEAAVFDKVLNSTEINDIMDNGLQPAAAGRTRRFL